MVSLTIGNMPENVSGSGNEDSVFDGDGPEPEPPNPPPHPLSLHNFTSQIQYILQVLLVQKNKLLKLEIPKLYLL